MIAHKIQGFDCLSHSIIVGFSDNFKMWQLVVPLNPQIELRQKSMTPWPSRTSWPRQGFDPQMCPRQAMFQPSRCRRMLTRNSSRCLAVCLLAGRMRPQIARSIYKYLWWLVKLSGSLIHDDKMRINCGQKSMIFFRLPKLLDLRKTAMALDKAVVVLSGVGIEVWNSLASIVCQIFTVVQMRTPVFFLTTNYTMVQLLYHPKTFWIPNFFQCDWAIFFHTEVADLSSDTEANKEQITSLVVANTILEIKLLGCFPKWRWVINWLSSKKLSSSFLLLSTKPPKDTVPVRTQNCSYFVEVQPGNVFWHGTVHSRPRKSLQQWKPTRSDFTTFFCCNMGHEGQAFRYPKHLMIKTLKLWQTVWSLELIETEVWSEKISTWKGLNTSSWFYCG